MSRQSHPKSNVGFLALMVVVLADIGLVIWYWHWRQSNMDTYSAIGLNLPVAEPAPRPPREPLPAPEFDASAQAGNPAASTLASATTGLGSILIKPEPGMGMGMTPPKGEIPSEARTQLAQAAGAFIALQKKPQYQQSPVLREWRRDFTVAYPDLRDINRKYWKDRDAAAFVVATLRSPNFAKLLKKFAGSPDLQAFVKDVMQVPAAMAGGRLLLEDRSIMAAVKDMTLPGLPSIGTLMGMGERAAKGGPPGIEGAQIRR